MLLSLTPAGRRLMGTLFPKFNQQEVHVVAPLTDRETQVLTTALRKVVMGLESPGS